MSYHRIMAFGGLGLIALGTGGIKPCVAAFGGDQFKEHQVINIQIQMFSNLFCLLEASIVQVLLHFLFLH